MIYNEKKLIKRILSIGMAFVLIFSNTHLETYAAGNEPILTVNNGRYNLPLKTSSQSAPVLPEGLSWNKSEELLIMNNYVGGAIEIENYGSRFSGIANFTIELIGENNISFISGEDYGGFLSNNHITFKGNGSLKLNMIERGKASSIFTAIRVNGGDLILKDNVHLEIYMHAQRIDYFEAIDVSTLEVKDDAKIVIDARGKKVVGMRNILIVNNNASVDIRVKGEQKTIGWQTPLTTGAGNAMKIETNGEFNIVSESTGGVALAIDNARRNPRKSDPDNTPVHIKSGYVQLKSKSPLPESKAIAKPLAGKGNFAYSFTGENSEVEKYAPVRLTSPFHIATADNRSDELENNDSILLGAVPSNRNYIVLGVDFFNEEVTWSISGQHSRDTKIENGLLTIGKDERKTRITVSARHKRENTTVTKVFQVIPKATLRFEAKEYGSFEGQTEKIKEIRVLAETPNALKESDIPTPVADVGAEFIGWNRELPNGNTIFYQTEKYQYEAQFRKKEYLITKDVPESLDINIVVKEKDTQRNKSENEAVHYNDIIELQIKPKDKKQHVLHSVVVKRKSNDEIIKRFSINLSGEVTDSFIMPAENVEIQAVSEKKGYTISKQKAKGVTIQVPQSAKNGDKVLVSANSEDAMKYEVKQILVTKENGELVEPLEQVDGNTRFTMPTENVNVTAKVKYLIETHLLPSEDVKVMVNSKTETVKALPGEKIQIDLILKKPKLKAIENIVVKDSANHVIAVNYLNDTKTSAEFIMPQDTVSVTTTLRNKPIIVERIGDVHLGKKIYAAGENLSIQDMTANIQLSDDTSKIISLQDFSANGIEMLLISNKGSQEQSIVIQSNDIIALNRNHTKIVLKYQGQVMKEIPITVGDAKVNNLSIEGDFKKSYAAGERLDFGNAKLVIRKTDASEEKVLLNNLPSEFTITPSKTAELQKSDSEIVITHTGTQTSHRIPITVGDAKVNNLSVEGDFKKSYAAGERLDFGNAKLVIQKTDGSEEKVSLNALSNEYTISPSKTAGLQKSDSEIVITHNATKTMHRIPITVGDAKVNNLSIEGTVRTEYAAGERLDFGNAKLVIRKTDGSEEKISLNNLPSEFTITPNKTARLQKSVREILITHTGTQTSHRISITVGDAKVNNLSIEGDFKKNYAAGESIDFGNAKLVIRKTDGSEEKVSLNNLPSEFTITPSKTAGLQKSDREIVITHTGTQTSHRIPITVGDAKVNNLSIEGDFKKSYAAGERLDFGNAKLVIRKTDGSEEKVLLNALSNEYTISPSKTAGLQKSDREIVITHTGTQTSHRIPITVGDSKVNNLSIEGTVRTEYAAGERLDFGNAKLVIQKTDGSEEKVSLNNLPSEFTITPSKTAGLQKSVREIVITHTETQTSHRIPITVGDAKVNNLSIEGDFKKNYAAGERLDFGNAKLVIRKTDGSQEKVLLNALSNEYTISPSKTAGLQKGASEIVITHNATKTMHRIPITVGDAKVNNLSVEGDFKKSYAAGERLDFGNAKLVIQKTDGSQEKVSLNALSNEYTISPSKTAGLQKSVSEIVITHTGTQTSHRIPITVGDAKVNNLSIEGDFKKSYAAGERLDFGNAKLVIRKTDGSQEKVSLNALSNEYTISPSKTAGLQKGNREIVITHTGTQTSHRIPITVGDAKVNNLSVEGDFKKSYAAGDRLDFGNAKLVIQKTDGSQEKVLLNALSNEYTISPNKTAGLQKIVREIVITHTGTQTSHRIPITVGDAKVNNLSIEGTVKTEYAAGERLDFGNAKLVIRKTDASEEKVSLNNLPSEFTITPSKTAGLQKGNREIVITHTETQTSHRIPITVGDAKVNNLSIEGDFKKNYAAGERLNFGNAKLVIRKTDGSEEKASLNNLSSEFTITPSKTAGLQKGNREIVITHNATKTMHRIPITVGDAKVNNLAIEGTVRTEYAAGERLDFGNAKLVIRKTDGSEEKVSLNALSNEYTISPSKTTGLQKSDSEIVITHTGTQTSHRIPITVGDAKVNNLSIEGDFKKSYAAGERLDFGNAKLVIRKTDASEEKVLLNALSNEYTISPNKTAGLQKSVREIVITHTGTQTIHRIPITVGDAKPQDLLLSPPTKRIYDKGDIFIPDGMMATITKTDGSSIQLIPFSRFGAHHLELVTPVAGAKLMQEGQQRVLVRYQKNGESLEGETTIEVGAAQLRDIEWRPPTKQNYVEGQTLSQEGMEIKLKWSDREEIVPLDELANYGLEMIPSFGTPLTVSNNKIEIRHTDSGKRKEHTLTVVPISVTGLTANEIKKDYVENNLLDLSNLIVTLHKNNGTQEEVNYADFANYNLSVNPEHRTKLTTANSEVVITHAESKQKTSIPIRVEKAKVVRIEIIGLKEKYFVGDVFSANDIRVRLQDRDGALSDEISFAQFKQNGLMLETGNLMLNNENQAVLSKGSYTITLHHTSGVSNAVTIQVEDKVTLKLSGGFPEEFNPKGFLVLDILRIVRTVNNADEEIIDFKKFAEKGIEISHANSMPLERDFDFVITDTSSGARLSLPVNIYWGIRYQSGKETNEEIVANQKYNGEEQLRIILPQNTFTPPEGKEFAGWKVNPENSSDSMDEKLYPEGEEYLVESKVTFVAQWKGVENPPVPPSNPNNSQALPPGNPDGKPGGGKDEDKTGNDGDGGDGNDGDGKKTDENTTPKPNTDTGGTESIIKDEGKITQPDNSVQTGDGSSTSNNPNPPSNPKDGSQETGSVPSISPGDAMNQSDNSSQQSGSGNSGQPEDNVSAPNDAENGSQETGNSGATTQTAGNPSGGDAASSDSATGENQDKDSEKTELPNPQANDSTKNSSTDDEAQRQKLEQIEREKEAERQRQLEEQERIERQREIDRQREERQFENQNYSYIGEQPKSEAIPKSKPENPNLMNKNGEESAKSMSPQEPFNLGKLVGELRIGEREYRQLENDVLVTKVMDVPPMIHENRTMLPARVVAELLNIDVDFDDASKTAYFRYDGNLIELALGQQRMKINGEEKMLSANVLNVQGRVLMPITDIQRALVDLGLHVDVNWKHFEKEVQVIDKDK